MQLIRQFELMAEEKYKMDGKIRGFFHAYIGQEAIAAGCMTATKPEDTRLAIAIKYPALVSKVERKCLYGRVRMKIDWQQKGKGGSRTSLGWDVNFFGYHGIVGAQIGTGVGLAFVQKDIKAQDVMYRSLFLVMVPQDKGCFTRFLISRCFGNCL